MSIQYLINNASEISYNIQPIVASTVTRSGITRTISRNNSAWRFTVTLPTGPNFGDYREALTDFQLQGQTTSVAVNFQNAGIFDYLGDVSAGTDVTSAEHNPTLLNNQIYISTVVEAGKYVVRKGDVFSYAGYLYMAENDVLGAGTVNAHRPLIDVDYTTTSTDTMRFRNPTVTVRVIEMPSFTVFGGNQQIQWSGPMVLQEVL